MSSTVGSSKSVVMAPMTAPEQSSGMLAIDRLALRCEQLWNESGKLSASNFARQTADLHSLREGLRVGDSLTRTKIVYLLSLLKPSDVSHDLAEVLRADDCPVVRHEAAYFLGTMHFDGAVDSLGKSLLRDPHELVRHEAAEALGELGSENGLVWLERATSDPSPLVRRTIEIAVRHIALKSNSS